KRLPVNDIFLSKLNVFGSSVCLQDTDRETSFSNVLFVAQTIGGFDEDALKKEWFALPLDFALQKKISLAKLRFDDMWKQILQKEYPNLTKLLNAVQSLPNSNLYLNSFVEELTSLYEIKVHTIVSLVDSIARSILQAIVQYNGRYGCSFCLHEGGGTTRTLLNVENNLFKNARANSVPGDMAMYEPSMNVHYEGILEMDFLQKHKIKSNQKNYLQIDGITLKLHPYRKITTSSEMIVQAVTDKNHVGIEFIRNCLVASNEYTCLISMLNTTGENVEIIMPLVTIEELWVTKKTYTLIIKDRHLNKEEKKTIEQICEDFNDIFHLEGDILTHTITVAHEINTRTDNAPVNVLSYRLPEKHKEEVTTNKENATRYNYDIIRPSVSQWNAPLLVVPKKYHGHYEFNRIPFGIVTDHRPYCSKFYQKNKLSQKTKKSLVLTDTPEEPFEKCALDIVGPLPITIEENKYILTFQDSLTKFSKAILVENQKASTIAKAFVTKIIMEHGLIYGHQATIPTALLQSPNPTYAYDDYMQELRTSQEKTFQGDTVLLYDKRDRSKKLESKYIHLLSACFRARPLAV
ncbi:POL4 protein, partial [Pseudoatta argentina]